MTNPIKLSIVIPGYRDPFHERTVSDIIQNSVLGEQLEIISVFDGFYPTWELVQDDRRLIIHVSRNRGMRQSINTGIAAARGEFVMRLDEHCCFAQGFDAELTEACRPNEIMTARRFFLDPVRWMVMDLPPVDHEKLSIRMFDGEFRKFSAVVWKERDDAQNHVPISETMALQGSMWLMPRSWWRLHIQALQTEGYGPLVQDSLEVCMKTWQNGGRVMLNKRTWFAHKHRDFRRTHHNGTPDNPAKPNEGFEYALEQWEGYYNDAIKPKWGLQ